MQFMLHHFIRNVFVFLNEASGGRYILRYNKQYEYNFLNGAKKKLMNFLELLLHTMNWMHVYLSSPFYSDNGLIKLPKYCVTFPWIFWNYFYLSGCHFFIHHCSEVAISFRSLLNSLQFMHSYQFNFSLEMGVIHAKCRFCFRKESEHFLTSL